jgi:alkylation response protein AidB-like acyl-CoA dehydrogenase
MSCELNDTQIKIREKVIKYVQNELTPCVDRIELTGEINEHDFIKFKDSGLWEDLTGNQTDWVTKVTILIELAQASPSFAGNFSDLLMAQSIKPGTDAEHGVFATAFVEEGAGSDLSSIQTEAKRVDDKWILNGEKWFVVNHVLTNRFMTLAKNEDQSLAIFEIPKDSPGITIREQKKMGLEGVKLAAVTFNQVFVPSDALVLSLEAGNDVLTDGANLSKLAISSLAIGIAEAALTASLHRARNRKQNGTAIGDYQAIQFKVAEMTVGINAAKTLLYDAAQKLDRKENIETEAAMAKVFSSEVANKVVDHNVQIHGAHGLLDDAIAARLYRDQRLTEVFGQTSEIQRLVISDYVINHIGLKEKEVEHGF